MYRRAKPEAQHQGTTRGSLLVEFAIMLPFLVILLAGVMQFSFLLHTGVFMTHTRDGTRNARPATSVTTINRDGDVFGHRPEIHVVHPYSFLVLPAPKLPPQRPTD